MENRVLKLKPLKEGNELSAFVNIIYNELFNQIDNLKNELKEEKEPLHYIVINAKLEEARNAFKCIENIIENCTEYIEVVKK